MNELTECGSYLDGEKIFASESEEKAGTVQRWIPITEKLPNDNDDRFYMCTVENHEEDLPMFCQYQAEIMTHVTRSIASTLINKGDLVIL